MKTTFKKLTGMLIVILVLFSCTNEMVDTIPLVDQSEFSSVTPGVIYPLAKGESHTRSTSFDTDWESYNEITLASGSIVWTPWGTTSSHRIPLDIARDIKRENGWEMIAHTITPNVQSGMNYIILHNYVTGVLKVFYCLENSRTNNMGVWVLEFQDSRQKMLNFTDQIADPLNYGERTLVETSNLTLENSKGFAENWNCFQVELAYDPHFTNGTMSISAHNMNIQNLNLEGQFQASTNGVLLMKSSSNTVKPLTDGFANVLGDAAKTWVNTKVTDGSVKNAASGTSTRAVPSGVINEIVGGGVKEIVKFGLNNIFNSFIGRFNETNVTSHDIQLKTEGVISLNGTIDFSNPAPIKPININCSVNNVGHLGAWSLETSPTLHVSPLGRYSFTPGSNEHFYISEGATGCDYTIRINPKLQSCLKSRTVDFQLIEYDYFKNRPTVNYPNFDAGELGYQYAVTNITTGIHLYSDAITSIFKSNADPEILTNGDNSVVSENGMPYNLIFIPNASYYYGAINMTAKNRFLRFSPQFITEINGKRMTTVNTKTYWPRYQWDPEMYSRFMSVSQKDVEFYKWYWGY